MAQEIGEENMFIFGLKAEEVSALKQQGYDPWHYYHSDPLLKEVIDSIRGDLFCPTEPGIFNSIAQSLLENGDPYLMLADFQSYLAASQRADELYSQPREWARTAIVNIARSGKFSADRAIREYAEDIWKVKQLQLDLH